MRQAVAGKDLEFEDCGEGELNGIERPVQAWAVNWQSSQWPSEPAADRDGSGASAQ